MAGELYDEPVFRVDGDRAFLVEYGDGIDLAVNERVRAMAQLLRMRPPPGLEIVLPSYRSLAVVYNPPATSPSKLKERILDLQEDLSAVPIPTPRAVEIPVHYGGDFGPDLDFVAETNGLTVEEVIEIHSAVLYHIYAIGFAPGFCYLGGMDPRIRAPRLETPRTLVPAGSVGIAESQTGVYPLAGPGGWRLIGRTPLKLFDPNRLSPFLYKTGDKIRFTPITERRYGNIAGGGST